MNLRDSASPLVRSAGEALARVNARHPWSHNAHFHRWIIRSLPPGPKRALDAGCGRGDLIEALRTYVPHVDGIDVDGTMAASAAARFKDDPGVTITQMSFLDPTSELPAEHYDVITMIAVLHHMNLEAALTQVRKLLNPGGRLLVVTLAPPQSFVDHVWDFVNALTNPLIGFVKHPKKASEKQDDARMPVKDPTVPYSELRKRVRQILPGAKIHRREGFRVTIRWDA